MVPVPSAESDPGNRRVLLVDDDEAITASVQLAARVYGGIELTCCRDIEQARHALHAGRYDLVLLDLWLGHHHGSELLGELEHMDPRPVVVVMSADPDARARVGRGHVDGWLSKPFDLDDLYALL